MQEWPFYWPKRAANSGMSPHAGEQSKGLRGTHVNLPVQRAIPLRKRRHDGNDRAVRGPHRFLEHPGRRRHTSNSTAGERTANRFASCNRRIWRRSGRHMATAVSATAGRIRSPRTGRRRAGLAYRPCLRRFPFFCKYDPGRRNRRARPRIRKRSHAKPSAGDSARGIAYRRR